MILKIKSLLLFLFLLVGLALHAQDSTTYISPVSWPIKLSGTFGELRPGHFHMGIDIKSPNGGVGHAIRTIADGYVSRLKVSSGGYGKVLYIIHPDGHESVYAHLQRYIPEIEAYLKEQQYEKQSYEVDLSFFPDQFTVKKGQAIGQMGMTGRTFGPHLHFELRDKWTGLGLNPLDYGIKVEDTEAPRLYQIVVYELDLENRVLAKQKIEPKNLADPILVGSSRVGIGVKAYDRMEKVRNLNGVHSIEMWEDDELKYRFDCDTLDHSQQRYINAHKDFLLFQEDAAYVNRMFKLKGNHLNIYEMDGNNGVIELGSYDEKRLTVKLNDSFGNERQIGFRIAKVEEKSYSNSMVFNHEIDPNAASVFSFGEMKVNFKPGGVYQNVYAKITSDIDDSTGTKIYRIHHRNEPVHLPYQLSLHLPLVADSLRSKYFISGISSKGEQANLGGRWEADTLKAMLYSFGDFSIGVDTIPPTIAPKSFDYDLTKAYSMSFTIKDEFPRTGLKYRAMIDDEWILMEYDAKRDRLTHHFDGGIGEGEHQLVIEVEDRNGNVRNASYTFTR